MGQQIFTAGLVGGLCVEMFYLIFRGALTHKAYIKPLFFIASILLIWLLIFMLLPKHDLESFLNLGGVVTASACVWGGFKYLGESLEMASVRKLFEKSGVKRRNGNFRD